MGRKLKNKSYEKQHLLDLLDDYQSPVYNLCLYMIGNQQEAVEVAQSVFIRLYVEGNASRNNVSSKLFYITADAVLTWLRKGEATDDSREMEGGFQVPAAFPKVMFQLTAYQRLAILLHHKLGFSIQEICEIIALPIETVKEHLHGGREALRNERNNNEG